MGINATGWHTVWWDHERLVPFEMARLAIAERNGHEWEHRPLNSRFYRQEQGERSSRCRSDEWALTQTSSSMISYLVLLDAPPPTRVDLLTLFFPERMGEKRRETRRVEKIGEEHKRSLGRGFAMLRRWQVLRGWI